MSYGEIQSFFNKLVAIPVLLALTSCGHAMNASAGFGKADAYDVSTAVVSNQVSRSSISRIDTYSSFALCFPNAEDNAYIYPRLTPVISMATFYSLLPSHVTQAKSKTEFLSQESIRTSTIRCFSLSAFPRHLPIKVSIRYIT